MDDSYGQQIPIKEPRRKRTTSSGSDDIKTPVSLWLDSQTSGIKHKRLKTGKEETDVAFRPCEEEEGAVTRADDAYDSPPDDDDDDSIVDSDFSDLESEGSHSSFIEDFIVTGRKEKRFFWQYNTQSKGPKGKRLCKTISANDPHVLNDFEDPVFDPDLRDARYKHSGKARRGDGNDITPSPYRLFQIGNQLKRLNRQINDIVPMMEMPQGVRNDKRKEKNKYASKVCRLKKKAQHEANKLKLYGLDQEHAQLMEVLHLLKKDIKMRLDQSPQADDEPLSSKLDSYIRRHLVCGMVAGNAADFVNSILEKVANGDKTGGITLMD